MLEFVCLLIIDRVNAMTKALAKSSKIISKEEKEEKRKNIINETHEKIRTEWKEDEKRHRKNRKCHSFQRTKSEQQTANSAERRDTKKRKKKNEQKVLTRSYTCCDVFLSLAFHFRIVSIVAILASFFPIFILRFFFFTCSLSSWSHSLLLCVCSCLQP